MTNAADILDPALPEFPRLAPWVRRMEHEDGALVLRSQDRFHTVPEPLFGALFDALAPALDGSRHVSAVLASLPRELLPTSGVALLKILRSLGLLFDEAEQGGPPGTGAERDLEAFLGLYGPQPREVRARLRAARAGVFGAPEPGTGVREECEALGIRPAPLPDATGPDALPALRGELARGRLHLLIAVDVPDAAAVNRLCLDLGVPCLYAENHGREALLGPLVIPGQSACRACLDARLDAHLAVPPGVRRTAADAAGAARSVRPGPLARVLGAQLGLEAARYVSGFAPAATIGHCFWLSASAPLTEQHRLLRVPGCTACSHRRAPSAGVTP